MEKKSQERKYEDKMNKDISIEDLRKEKIEEKLSLRKAKMKNHIILGIKEKINLMHEFHYNIHLNLLKTDNDDIRSFSIDIKNPESITGLKYLLTSQDDDEVKFGLYALRKYLQNLIRELYYKDDRNFVTTISSGEIKESNTIDIFIENNIINLLTIPLLKLNSLILKMNLINKYIFHKL